VHDVAHHRVDATLELRKQRPFRIVYGEQRREPFAGLRLVFGAHQAVDLRICRFEQFFDQVSAENAGAPRSGKYFATAQYW